ncbi:MAG: hypothetical protein HQK93_10480 [Nitrospirae bacterium]|nr:hypothetical protein [Nitrospirota bacterium]
MQNAEVYIRHSSVSGRVRLKVKALYRSDVLRIRIENTLKSNEYVTDFSINILTGSVLVFHNHGSTYATIVMLLEQIVAEYLQTQTDAATIKPSKKNTKSKSNTAAKIKNREISKVEHKQIESDTLWHTVDVEKALTTLNSSLTAGLTSEEALKRYALYGPNELKPSKPRSKLSMLIEQFNSLPVYLL